MISSVITASEYLVYPYRTANQQKVEAFFEFIDACDIPLVHINTQIASTAAQIRAEYHDYKAMDCLQLAAAICTGCDLFLTNDKQLRSFQGIQCKMLEEWEF